MNGSESTVSWRSVFYCIVNWTKLINFLNQFKDEDETFLKMKKLRQSEKFDPEEENSNRQNEVRKKMDDISIEDAEDISDDELLKQDEPNGYVF